MSLGLLTVISATRFLKASANAGDDQVIFYADSNFLGAQLSYSENIEVSDLTLIKTGLTGTNSWNDWISSVELGKNKKIICYQDINFGEPSYTFQYDSCNSLSISWKTMPRNWNDRISSFKIQDGNPPVEPSHSTEQVLFFEDNDFTGTELSYTGPVVVENLTQVTTSLPSGKNWNDRISSYVVGSGMKVYLYKDITRNNLLYTVTGPATEACLRSKQGNDVISSFKIVNK
jgi:hypothetical protein